ncbi:AMP-binding protein [Planomonospora parontospora]|uniref:AMP-binding protein n=1 Tax=Planomonospora parontospora TaxID=58119 RepID=UPI003620543B
MTVDVARIDAAGRRVPAAAGGPGTPGRVHEAIEAQCRRTPERTAVVAGTSRLSYAELDRRADGVARTLAGRGIGRGDLVGICLERGEWLLPALVGVWKSGAAYVPLDPAYPAERLRFMAEDAAVAAVVTSAALRETAALTGAGAVLVGDVEPGEGAPRGSENRVTGSCGWPGTRGTLRTSSTPPVPPGRPRAWWWSTATP